MDYKESFKQEIQNQENVLQATVKAALGQNLDVKDKQTPLEQIPVEKRFVDIEISNQEKFRKDYIKEHQNDAAFKRLRRPPDYMPEDIKVNEIKYTYLNPADYLKSPVRIGRYNNLVMKNDVLVRDFKAEAEEARKIAEEEEELKEQGKEIKEKKQPQAQFKRKYGFKVQTDAVLEKKSITLMKSTYRFTMIEQKKRQLYREMFSEEAKKKLNKENLDIIEKYGDIIFNLGPSLMPIISTKSTANLGEVKFTPESVEAYQSYLKTVLDDPVEAIHGAMMDTLHAVTDFPDKLLGEEGISASFDKVMQIRNRYEAINKLKNLSYMAGSDTKDADKLEKLMTRVAPKKDIKKERELQLKKSTQYQEERHDANLHDERFNFQFIKLMTKALDADMSAILQKSNIEFNKDMFNRNNSNIQTDGDLALRAMRSFRAGQRKRTQEEVDHAKEARDEYWEHRENEMLTIVEKKEKAEKKEENAEQKKEQKTDSYYIQKALKDLKEKADNNKELGYNKKLATEVSKGGMKIANAISELDIKNEKLEKTLELDEVKGSPILTSHIKQDISRNKYKKALLLERSRGYINVIDHILNGSELNEMGKMLLHDVQSGKLEEDGWVVLFDNKFYHTARFTKPNKEELNEIAEDERLRSSEVKIEEVICILNPELQGKKATVAQIAETVKNAMIKQKQDADSILTRLRGAGVEAKKGLMKEMIEFRKRSNALEKLQSYAVDGKGILSHFYESMTKEQLDIYNKVLVETNIKTSYINSYVDRYRDDKIIKLMDGGDDLEGLEFSPREKSEAVIKSRRIYRLEAGLELQFKDHKAYLTKYLEILTNEINKAEMEKVKERQEAEDNDELDALLDVETFEEILDSVNMDTFDKENEVLDIPKLDDIKQRRKEEKEREKKEREERIKREKEEEERKKEEERQKEEREREEERQREEERRREEEQRRENGGGPNPNPQDEKEWKKDVAGKVVMLTTLDPEKEYEQKYGPIQGNDKKSVFTRHLLKSYKAQLVPQMKTFYKAQIARFENKDIKDVTDDEVTKVLPKQLPPADEVFVEKIKQYQDAVKEGKSQEECAILYGQISEDILDDYKVAFNAFNEAWKMALKTTEIEMNMRQEPVGNVENVVYNAKNYDVEQRGDLTCWACTSTYTANYYKDHHHIRGLGANNPSFDKKRTFLDVNNIIMSKDTSNYIDTKNDPDVTFTFNEALNEHKESMNGDKMNNTYVMADLFLRNLSDTALKRIVLNFDSSNPMLADPESKKMIEDRLLKKIQTELQNAGGPISILKPGHYFTLIGVRNGRIILRSSTNDPLDEDLEMTPADIIAWGTVEITALQYLSDDKKRKVVEDYNTGADGELYDEEGKITAQRPFENEEDKNNYVSNPEHMLHNLGVEFDLKEEKTDSLLAMFGKESIYMPKNLDAKKNVKDNIPAA